MGWYDGEVSTLLRRYRTVALVLAAIAGWSALLYAVSPLSLVERIGVENAYLVAFFITLVAGCSSFTGGAAYATVIEFSRGGAHPLWLGLISGTALFLSDSIFYLLILRGRESVEGQLHSFLGRLERFFKRIPGPFVYLFTFLFCALGPIPNDAVLLALLLAGYRYRRFWPALLAGDIAFMLFLSYLFQ
jgi:hypothetical protein